MKTQLLRALGLTAIMMVIVGIGYPMLGVLIGDVAFHHQANGSITKNGSTEIGQPWTYKNGTIDPNWFQGRPDADNPLELNGVSGTSGASNLGPKSKTLKADVAALAAAYRAHGVSPTPDLVTTSASGVDPDISPLDAMVQVHMVATARHLAPAVLIKLIHRDTQPAQWGFLGSPYINVLQLNEGVAALVKAQHAQ